MNLLDTLVVRALGAQVSAQPLVRPADAVLARELPTAEEAPRGPAPDPVSAPRVAPALRASEPAEPSAFLPERDALVSSRTPSASEPRMVLTQPPASATTIIRLEPTPVGSAKPEPPLRERVERTLERVILREHEAAVPAEPLLRVPSASASEPTSGRPSALPELQPAGRVPPAPPPRPQSLRAPKAEAMRPERTEGPRPRAAITPRIEPARSKPEPAPKPSLPVVHVHIDRIVVNAEPQPRVAAPSAPRSAGADELLARYLAGRSGAR